MALSLIVLVGVYLIYDASEATFWRGVAKVDIQQGTRWGLEQMRRELRMAGYDPSGTGQAAVQNATISSLEFITDVDENGVSDLVRYGWDASVKRILRTVKPWAGTGWGAPSVTTVAALVDSLSFQYFPGPAVPGLTRIRVTIHASGVASHQVTQQHQVITDVFLRNL